MALHGAAKAEWRRNRREKSREEGRRYYDRKRLEAADRVAAMPPKERAAYYLARAPYAGPMASALAAILRGLIQPEPITNDERLRRAAVDRRYKANLRLAAIAHLGGACACCGMDLHEVLQFDHKEPLLRKTNGIRGHEASTSARQILSGQEGLFQLLCANCHVLKTRYNNEYCGTRQDIFSLAMELIKGNNISA